MDITAICWLCMGKALMLLFIANGAPVLMRNLLKKRYETALDFGTKLADKRPLFGYSKTWRGVVASLIMTTLLAPIIGVTMALAAKFSALAMAGDLLSSFIKRRLGYSESSRSRLLDVIPESALPLVLLSQPLGLSPLAVLLTICVFFVLEIILSLLLYRLHIRKRPY